MILIDAGRLKFLKAGRTLELDSPHRYRIGRDYDVGVKRDHPILRVTVLSCDPSGGDRYALRIRQNALEPARYLTRSAANTRSYTDRPSAAARDRSGPLEAIPNEDLKRYARAAFERDDQIRRERIAAQPLRNRRTWGYSALGPLAASPFEKRSGRPMP